MSTPEKSLKRLKSLKNIKEVHCFITAHNSQILLTENVSDFRLLSITLNRLSTEGSPVHCPVWYRFGNSPHFPGPHYTTRHTT